MESYIDKVPTALLIQTELKKGILCIILSQGRQPCCISLQHIFYEISYFLKQFQFVRKEVITRGFNGKLFLEV